MHGRTQLLLGGENLRKIQECKVIVFGVGGVGSWCAEGLVRSGISHLTLVDFDSVCPTNCNRQLMATSRTLGRAKVEVMRERLLEINPDAEIVAVYGLYNAETAGTFHLEEYDCIVDAIDSVRDKADLIRHATSLPRHVFFISSMGAALRRDPLMVRKAEFRDVKGDALARALRNRFKKEDSYPRRKFQCVYSVEQPMKNLGEDQEEARDLPISKKQTNGSLCHVTATFGMVIAGTVLNNIVDSLP